MDKENKFSRLQEELKFLNRQKKSLLERLNTFEAEYISEIYPLHAKLVSLKKNAAYKKYTTILKCYKNLEDEFNTQRKKYLLLIQEKNKILKALEKAKLAQYFEYFEDLILVQKTLEPMKEELLNIKQLLKKLHPQKHKSNYENTLKEYENILAMQVNAASEYQQMKDVKKLYREVSKLCHPDLVEVSNTQEAKEIFQRLNDAYTQKNLDTMNSLYTYLKANNILPIKKDFQTQDEYLKEKTNLLKEIEALKENHVFSYALKILDIKKYSIMMKKKLQKQLDSFEAVKYINNDETYTIARIYTWAMFHQLDHKVFSRNVNALKKLEFLNLSNQKIVYLLDDISFLKSLKKIDLSNNTIASLPENLASLKNLEELNLANNDLDKLPSAFSALKKLKHINLMSNRFEIIPPVVVKCASLEILNLSDNKINTFPNILLDLKFLRELYCNNNTLNLIPSTIIRFKKLEVLEFSENNISDISPEIYSMEKLKTFSLWGNTLREIPLGIAQLKNLQELNLGRNILQKLPLDIVALKNIINLNLTMNKHLQLSKEQKIWSEKIYSSLF